jgi:hypothetical protein
LRLTSSIDFFDDKEETNLDFERFLTPIENVAADKRALNNVILVGLFSILEVFFFNPALYFFDA